MQLKTDHLTIDVAEPGTRYARTRFDWLGFVTQVTWRGRHTFCAPEALTPGPPSCDGEGLCGEFGIMTAVGYDDARPGECFPKIGVGLLTRPDEEPYRFVRDYACRPFPTSTHVDGPARVRFEQAPVDRRGYAVRYAKELGAEANRLTVTCRLENVGARAIRTEEYLHNFLAIDGQPVGPDYRLSFDFPPRVPTVPPGVALTGREVTWTETPRTAFYFRPDGFAAGRPVACALVHGPRGIGVGITADFPAALVAVWGVGHVVSPEVFYRVDLAPGQTATWSRTYIFGLETEVLQGLG